MSYVEIACWQVIMVQSIYFKSRSGELMGDISGCLCGGDRGGSLVFNFFGLIYTS